MLETFKATLSPMLVMFLCIVIGYILNKKKLVPDNAATVLSKLENYVLVPAIILNTFMNYCTVASITEYYRCIIYCVIALAVGIAIAVPLANVFEKNAYNRNIYRYALTFGNFGFMGNAIVPAIMGEEFLYPYMLFTMPLNITVYTVGLMWLIPRGEKKQNIFKNLINPVFISLVAGIILGLSGVTKYVPGFATTVISNCAACMGPVSMILTGLVIGGYNIGALLKKPKVYIATFLRLIVFPILLISILWLCKADKTIILLCMFGFATPLGLNTVIFPAAYGSDTSTGASMAMISHTLCVITIPLMYAVLNVIL